MKTSSYISFRLINRSLRDNLVLYIMFPTLHIGEDLDYTTLERGVNKVELNADTGFKVAGDRDHWTVGIRVLGFGLTLSRQKGY